MECGFAEDSAEPGIGSGIEEAESDVFGKEAGGPDEWSIAFAIPLEIEFCAGLDERVNERQCGAMFQCAFKEDVGDIVQRVGENAVARAAADERIGPRCIFNE